MLQTLIINEERLDVKIGRMWASVDLHDITPVGRLATEVMAAGPRRLVLEGTTADDREVRGVFRVIRVLADGALEIEPWTDQLEVGGGTKHETRE